MPAHFTRDPVSGAMQQNTYATGLRQYGAAGLPAATSGMLSSDGYNERQRKMIEKRRALQNRLRQGSGLGTMSPEMGGY